MLKTLSQRELEDALKLAVASAARTSPRARARTTASKLNEALSALALRHRLEIIEFLRDGPRTARQISDAIGGHRASLSRHLKQLADAGLITIETSPLDARERIVSLRAEPFDILAAWIDTFKKNHRVSGEA